MSSVTVAPVRQPSIGALRQRRDMANRPGLSRISTRGNTVDAIDTPFRPSEPPPLVKTPAYILRKYQQSSPSLVIHLHPTYLRFDQQDGNFPYTAPISRSFLKHLKDSTVPHDIMEELFASAVPFYEGCLIVEVHNHRNSSNNSNATTNQVGGTSDDPFSIHNYNEHIIPSAYMPMSDLVAKSEGQSKAKGNTINGTKEEPGTNKENMPAPGQPASATKPQPKGPTIHTTVLFPTALTLEAEKSILATVVYDDSALNKRLSVESGGLPHPPTPLASIPSTPTVSSQLNPNKKPRMILDQSNVKEFEAEVLLATNPVLYLEPAKDFAHQLAIMDALRHPLHDAPAPKPKSRKRTIAEVAAEEADAEIEQRFILNGDERQMAALANGSGAATANNESQSGTEFSFKRFKALEQIRYKHRKMEEERKEKESRNIALKAQQESQAAEKKKEREKAMEQQRLLAQQQQAAKQKREQMEQLKLQQQAQSLQQQNQGQNAEFAQAVQNLQGQMMPNGVKVNPQQMMNGVSAPQQMPQVTAIQMSPVVRQQTPMNGSPSMNGTNMPLNMTSVPMMPNSSNQGAGSPGMSQADAQAHAAMVRSLSQQPGQMGPSAAATPLMQSTPRMTNANPTQRMTPQPRLQGSPVPGQLPQNAMMMTPQQSQQGLTPEAAARMNMLRQQQQQQQYRQAVMSGQVPMQGQNIQINAAGQMNAQQLQALQAMQQRNGQMNPQMQQVLQQNNMRPNGTPMPPQQQQAMNMLQKLSMQARSTHNPQIMQFAANSTKRYKEIEMMVNTQSAERQRAYKMQFQGQMVPIDAQRKFTENELQIQNQQYQTFNQQVNQQYQALVRGFSTIQNVNNQQQQAAHQQQQQQQSMLMQAQLSQQQQMNPAMMQGMNNVNVSVDAQNAARARYAQQLQHMAQRNSQQNMMNMNMQQMQQMQQQMNGMNGMQQVTQMNAMQMNAMQQMQQGGQPGMQQGGQHGMGM